MTVELASTINRRASSRGVRFPFFCARPAARGTLELSERQCASVPRIARLTSTPYSYEGSFVLARGPTLANYSYAARPQEDAPACLNLPYSKIKALPKLLGRRAPAPERALK